MNDLVKRTERGWAGHYICADRCRFRRNTLLEYQDKKWIVSTVGNFVPSTRKTDMIGANRWYETMVFEAEMKNGYIDADVTKQIYPENDWGIWGESWEQVITLHPYPDNDANDMHELIVNEMAARIVERRGRMTSKELLACLTDRPCEVCKFHTEQGCSSWNCVFEGEIEEVPSAEPEVIRCKDCKYHVGEGCCDYWDEGRMFLDISDSDYCSKAERREEE